VDDAAPASEPAAPAGKDVRQAQPAWGTQKISEESLEAALDWLSTEPSKPAPPADPVSPSAGAPASEAVPPPSADVPVNPQPASMAISRYEDLVAERLWETKPSERGARWHWANSRWVIAGTLLVLLAALALLAFLRWRTPAPAPVDSVSVRPAPKEQAVQPPPAVQEPQKATVQPRPQSVVPAPSRVQPRTTVERVEPPAASVNRTPTVTHTRAAAAAEAESAPAQERAKPRAPQAAKCSDAVTVLGLCGPPPGRGNPQ
jgi:hypothetical protein